MDSFLEALPAAAEYAFLLRVQLLAAALLILFPFLAFFTPARSLFQGFFDLTPGGLLIVTMTALASAATSCITAWIVLTTSSLRLSVEPIPEELMPHKFVWLAGVLAIALPVIVSALVFSTKEGRGLLRLLVAVIAGVTIALTGASVVADHGTHLLQSGIPPNWFLHLQSLPMAETFLGGYLQFDSAVNPLPRHLGALAALLTSLLFYTFLGIWGYTKIGKSQTVPALCSALMLLLMLTWTLSGVAFFFDAFRIPVFLALVAWAFVTAQSTGSDHYYTLRKRKGMLPACPHAVITATGSPRVIVVAANGGGIQAGAWAAKVLEGLHQECGKPFDRALRLISSVSGGSVGAACYVHWLANPSDTTAPSVAAARSSLDEVAWGLAWSDFLKLLLPWVFFPFLGRGLALEKAWSVNSAGDRLQGRITETLGDWNEATAAGQLPGLIMNATIAESGERLLLGTTKLRSGAEGRGRIDGTEFHLVNGEALDLDVVTAARLSATFPYVTPAARANLQGTRAHVVDGGYYDNYGMATLVEWVEEALEGANGSIQQVLVIQIHGSPVGKTQDLRQNAKGRGWFYQALAPLTAMYFTREAGQSAHNDIELELLTQKWKLQGVNVETVPFEFSAKGAPLSWHLTPSEVKAIDDHWQHSMAPCLHRVKAFLA